MSDAILPFSPSSESTVVGQAVVRLARNGDRTTLAHLYQKAPLRVLFPRSVERDVMVVALVTTSGGLVGGDRLDIRVAGGAGTAALVTGQAADKVYRSLGPDVQIDVGLTVGRNAWLEWLPQETILFEGSRLVRKNRIDVEPGGQALAGEILVFGRGARGERFSKGRIWEGWSVYRDGRLLWADAFDVEGELGRVLASPACLNGAAAAATAVFVSDDAASALTAARSLVDESPVDAERQGELRVAATVVGGVLIVRWLGHDAARLRSAFGTFWAAFRHRVGGHDGRLPRLWFV